MKGRALILIFLFLTLSISIVSAETQKFEIAYDRQLEDTYDNLNNRHLNVVVDRIFISDIDYIEGFNYIVSTADTWYGSSETSDYVSTTFYNDIGKTNAVGSGYVGFAKFADGKYRIQFWFTSMNDSLSGSQTLYWNNGDLESMRADQSDEQFNYGTNKIRVGGKSGTSNTIINGDHYVKWPYHWSNTVTYDYNATSQLLDFDLDRSATYTSRLIIDDGNEELANETTQKSDDRYIFSQDLGNCTWDVTIYSSAENPVEHQLDYCTLMEEVPGPDGQVWFSKNYYQFPESVTVIADLDDDSDFDKYQYFVVMEEWNGTGWNCITYTFLLHDDERKFTWGELVFSQQFPTTLRAAIYGSNRGTGGNEYVAVSTNATYTIRPGEFTGQLWTNENVYNVSENIYIYYNTSCADNKVWVALPNNYVIWEDQPANTINTKILKPQLHQVGTWIIYLYENGILTNQTSIEIIGGSEIGCSWKYSDVPIGTAADFWYTSANSSAVITAWDGDGNQIYNSTTDIGTYQGSITTSGREPGIYLLSMLHNGTYYNSSMEVVAYDSWVRFDSSKYQIGDTINIEYFLIDDDEAISLWDGDSHLVIRFTQTNNVISTGYSKSVPFSLTDENEYGMDIEFGVGVGTYATGVWTVFIEDKYGALGDAWDSARVSVDTTDSPADSSDEMISIFFSPEGAFMLFTVCLTMMGLVAAKHPAGGGAGAVVGVGFGVYFAVLPPWMLLLMVIALVVMAGVSIAVYYKGK